jgi:FkbM family methyltransferase
MHLLGIANRILKPRYISRIKFICLRNALLKDLFHLRYFSLNGIDKKLERYLDYKDGYYVELGANDGVNQSNTLYFEHFQNWSGLLIEPCPENFVELIRNRNSRNFFKNVACVGPSHENSKVKLISSNLMTSTLGVASDVSDPKEHANTGTRFTGLKTHEFEAYALTLNEVLIEGGSPKVIDLLSLDVEGIELEILKGVDHSRFRFRYICVESRQFELINEYLSRHSYTFVESLSTHDFLFKNLMM